MKPQQERFVLAKPVFFVGFMGAGKTSVSRRLARDCHIASIDMDSYIERCEQMKIRAIFSERGEEAFRDLETELLEELSTRDPLLISCGGGIVQRERNREILKERGFVVYLAVEVDEAAERISDLSTRPLFADREGAKATHENRLPLYREVAHATVDTRGKTISRITREVKRILQKEGVLCRKQE